MGRKIKNPQVTKEDFLEKCEELHGQIYATCEALGISYKRYYNWRQEDPEFDKAIDGLQVQTARWIEQHLFTHIQEGNDKATMFYLKTNKYAKKIGYEVSQTITADVNSNQQLDIDAVIDNMKDNLVEE